MHEKTIAVKLSSEFATRNAKPRTSARKLSRSSTRRQSGEGWRRMLLKRRSRSSRPLPNVRRHWKRRSPRWRTKCPLASSARIRLQPFASIADIWLSVRSATRTSLPTAIPSAPPAAEWSPSERRPSAKRQHSKPAQVINRREPDHDSLFTSRVSQHSTRALSDSRESTTNSSVQLASLIISARAQRRALDSPIMTHSAVQLTSLIVSVPALSHTHPRRTHASLSPTILLDRTVCADRCDRDLSIDRACVAQSADASPIH